MPKNIVICLDGTGNEIEENISNILKIYLSIRSEKDQPVFYSQGVGTLVNVGLWSMVRRTLLDRVFGMVFGYGIDARVQAAYRFIVDHYEPGDRLFLFGYSRGAYTARILAGMIHAVGVLRPDQSNLIGAAYAAYLARPKRREHKSGEAARIPQLDPDSAEQLLADGAGDLSPKAVTFRRITQPHTVAVHYLGLFDTVGSVLVPGWGLGSLWPFRFNPYPHTFRNPSVRAVRHAVSIDERRQYFPVSLWPAGQDFKPNRFLPDSAVKPQRLDELWFPGAHGDVGGGNVRRRSGLSQIPLIWMMEGARESGLQIFERMFLHVSGQKPYSETTEHRYPAPDPTAPMHPSFAGVKGKLWFILELFPSLWRKVMADEPRCRIGWPPLGRRRHLPQDAKRHDSVLERHRSG